MILTIPTSLTFSINMEFSISESARFLSRNSFEKINCICPLINEDFICGILTKHKKLINCKSQLWEILVLSMNNETLAETVLPDSNLNEIDYLLLQASYNGYVDIIHYLCQHGANINCTEPDYGLTPLHLCAFRNCLDGVRYLIEHDAKVNTSTKHTPFHYAVFGDAFDVAQYFMQCGTNLESDNIGETVLHAAVHRNALRVLSLLASNSKELDRLDQHGYAAIHYAAKQSNTICLNVLLEAGCKVNLLTAEKNTTLHLAVEADCVDNLILLIKANADLELKNNQGYTALHLAAHLHSLKCVKILLNNKANPNAKDGKDDRTPLHLALTKPLTTLKENLIVKKITELLLCCGANVNKADKKGYTPLHIAAFNELSRCVNVLIKHEADLSARTIDGISALSIVLRKTPISLDIFKRRLDASLTLIGDCNKQKFMQLNFHPLLQHRRNQVSNLPEIGYLDAFVKEGYKEILKHLLCQSFLHFKWHKIRKYHAARLFFYLLYVLIFTSWMIIALAHNCYKESKDYNKTTTNSDIDNTTDIETLCHDNSTYKAFRNTELLQTKWYVLAVLNVLEAFRKMIVILNYRSVKEFLQIENLIECFMILSVFATSFMFMDNFVNDFKWQNYLGAFAVFCGWSNLMLIIGQLSMCGVYVDMLISVQTQIFKPFLIYTCSLLSFTASFCVLFPHTKFFGNPFIGFTKVLAMMSGELNFDNFFSEQNKGYDTFKDLTFDPFQLIVQFFFVLFFLFLMIALMNLLICIILHDMKKLQKIAILTKFVRQTKFIYNFEAAIIRLTIFMGSERFVKFMQRTMLLLPSLDSRYVQTVLLNSREKRLPQDILEAFYEIANRQNNSISARNRSFHAKACLKGKRRHKCVPSLQWREYVDAGL